MSCRSRNWLIGVPALLVELKSPATCWQYWPGGISSWQVTRGSAAPATSYCPNCWRWLPHMPSPRMDRPPAPGDTLQAGVGRGGALPRCGARSPWQGAWARANGRWSPEDSQRDWPLNWPGAWAGPGKPGLLTHGLSSKTGRPWAVWTSWRWYRGWVPQVLLPLHRPRESGLAEGPGCTLTPFAAVPVTSWHCARLAAGWARPGQKGCL